MLYRPLLATAATLFALASPSAHADPLYWSLNIGVPGVVTELSNAYAPAPVYVAPPPPVYVAPPPVAYYPGYAVPAPGYYPPGWYRHRGWRRGDDRGDDD